MRTGRVTQSTTLGQNWARILIGALVAFCAAIAGSGALLLTTSCSKAAEQRQPTEQEIGAAFDKAWESWRRARLTEIKNNLRKHQDDTRMISVGGVEVVAKEVCEREEKEAEGWKPEARAEFSKRYSGYVAMCERLAAEKTPNAEAAKTEWFSAMLNEVKPPAKR